MIGPVLYQEILLGARRNRLHVFRWVFAGWLLLNFLWIALIEWLGGLGPGARPIYFLGAVSATFTASLVVQQYLLALLATPAVVGGAITDEKRSGTLVGLLTTDLLPWQIVVGKLLARLSQVWLLLLTTLPLVAFIGVIGGMEPTGVAAVYLTLVFPTFGIGAASLLASVWTRQTRDAVLGVYLLALIAFLAFLGLDALGMPSPSHLFDPMYTLEPAWGKIDALAWRAFVWRLVESSLAWGLFGTVCLVLACVRLRGAFLRQLENSGKRKARRWWRFQRPAVPIDPIPWKERHVEGLAPLPILRAIPRWLGVILIFLGTATICCLILLGALPGKLSQKFQDVLALATSGQWRKLLDSIQPAPSGFYFLGLGSVLFFSLLVGIRCAGAVCGERERKCWDALLLTLLTEKELINGKLWGIINSCWPYYIAFLVPTIWAACAADLPSWFNSTDPEALSILFTLIWVPVTVLAMYFVGSAGMWCSTRNSETWKSLLYTIFWAYGGGAVALVVASPALFILWILIVIIVLVIGLLLRIHFIVATAGGMGRVSALTFQILCCVMLGLVSFLLSLAFLHYSRRYIAFRERTREWDADRSRSPRRRPRRPT